MHIINSYAYNSADYETHTTANLLTETLMIGDKVLSLSGDISLSFDKANEIINYICTS